MKEVMDGVDNLEKLGCKLELGERLSLTCKEKITKLDISLSCEKNHVENLNKLCCVLELRERLFLNFIEKKAN